MSHFVCVVVGPDPEGQLAPFDENIEVEPRENGRSPLAEVLASARAWADDHKSGAPELDSDEALLNWYHGPGNWKIDGDEFVEMTTYNPLSKWDWYVLGGRWRGWFKLKPGAEGLVGGPGAFGNDVEPGHADQVRKGDVDFEAMRAKARDRAVRIWEVVDRALDGHALPKMPAMGSGRDAWQAYHHDPVVEQVTEALKAIDEADFWSPLGELLWDGDRELHFEMAEAKAGAGFATLADGAWMSPGDMGWFGASTDGVDDRVAYYRKVREIVDGLPDDALLSAYDLHI